MKNRYSIGEVAALLNISPQALRYYDRTGVVRPDHIDQNTGYRYYSYDQVQYIDRIKYLQQFGFRLDEIARALDSNDVSAFQALLERRRQSLHGEIAKLQDLERDLEWYQAYYSHIDPRSQCDLPFQQREPTRFLLAEPIKNGETIYGAAGHRLTRLQHSGAFKSARFLRQNGYLLDYDALRQGRIAPTHYFVFLRQAPEARHPQIREIPAGIYYCMQSRILSEPFDNSLLLRYLPDALSAPLVLANEYEDNFTDFRHCIYEVQIQSVRRA